MDKREREIREICHRMLSELNLQIKGGLWSQQPLCWLLPCYGNEVVILVIPVPFSSLSLQNIRYLTDDLNARVLFLRAITNASGREIVYPDNEHWLV